MRHFTDTELTRMRATQDGAMQDECYVRARTVYGPDTWGMDQVTYERRTGSPVPCGVDPTAPREAHGTGEVGLIDVVLRLPLDTVVENGDRIELLSRYDEDLAAAEWYEIVGPVERGPSGFVLQLTRLTTGEE